MEIDLLSKEFNSKFPFSAEFLILIQVDFQIEKMKVLKKKERLGICVI